jgi:alkaline phosphatase
MRLEVSLRPLFALLALSAAAQASAAPTSVTLMPPDGARFLERQRFDLRVEGKGTGPFSATLAVDGIPVSFTSGALGTNDSDGITLPGWGGFNCRGHSIAAPGLHTFTATFTDSTGSASVTSRIQVIGLPRTHQGRPVKNIIFLLGDGMGLAHRTAARLVEFGVTGGDPGGRLAMEQLPGTGLVSTHSLSSFITDSSPGMSSYATGSHSNNNQEGVYPAHTLSSFDQPRVEYLSELLHRLKGTSLGLVTTADVEDATPAANAVHTGNRNAGTGICDQYLDEAGATGSRGGTGLTVLMGGGLRWFLPSTQFGSSRSFGTDYARPLPADLVRAWSLPASAAGEPDPERSLLADFHSAGFTYVNTATQLGTIRGRPPEKLLGLFAYGNMNVALDKIAKRRGVPLPGSSGFAVDDYHAPDQPMLDEMTEAALSVLKKNPKGFVLLVEGAHIDKQSHQMDSNRVIDEVIEFDRAVAVARRFAEEAGDTLVLVTADHECSGFSLIGALTGGIQAAQSAPSDGEVLDPAKQPARQGMVSSNDAAGFPHYTILPDGFPETLDVDGKMLVGFGAGGDRFETWLGKPLPVIDTLLSDDLKGELKVAGYGAEPYLRSSDQQGFFVRGQAVGHNQAVHTATDIALAAFSSGSPVWQDFVGVQTNTDVFFKMARAALVGSAGAFGR